MRASSCANFNIKYVTMDAASRCCCFLANKLGGTKGSGILFKFTADADTLRGQELTPDELLDLLPGVKKAGAIETTWAILTCHSIIPGGNHLAEGVLYFNGNEHKLDEIISGSVSCCGEDCFIGPGEQVLRKPHGDKNACGIRLDFTILFLKKEVLEQVVGQLQQPVTIPCDRKPCDWSGQLTDILNLFNNQNQAAHVHGQLALYCAHETESIQEHVITELCGMQKPPHNAISLANEIDTYIGLTKLNYQAATKDCHLSGGAIIHTKRDNSTELVGFHVGNGVGNTIYGIIRLLQGNNIQCHAKLSVLQKDKFHFVMTFPHV